MSAKNIDKTIDKKPIMNLVIYLGISTHSANNKNKDTVYSLGGHGYTYDIGVEGKKKLQKDAATTMGYYTGNPHSSSNVVDIVDIFSLTIPNGKSLIDVASKTYSTLIEYVENNNESIKNVCIITNDKIFMQFPSLLVDKLAQVKGGEFSDPKKLENLKDLQARYKKLVGKGTDSDHKFIVDLTGSVEGGKGNKLANQQLKLSEAVSLWSNDRTVTFVAIPRKDYENPESDFNKIVHASRWFFNTGIGEVNKFYELVEGYRVYQFGRVEPSKGYYGKLTPDVTYSKLYTKTSITILDKLFEYTKRTVKNPNELLSAGIISNVTSKDMARLIDTYPAVKDKENLRMPYQVGNNEEPLVIELINPPMLSYRIKESLFHIDGIFNAFINRNDSNIYKSLKFYDMTDLIYVTEENKKGVTKLKLHPEFTQGRTVFKVNVEHRNAVKKVPLMLSVGIDIPNRNSFNAVEDPAVKVWCVADAGNDKGIRFCSITETSDFIYVHTAGIANLRVLNLAELGIKK